MSAHAAPKENSIVKAAPKDSGDVFKQAAWIVAFFVLSAFLCLEAALLYRLYHPIVPSITICQGHGPCVPAGPVRPVK